MEEDSEAGVDVEIKGGDGNGGTGVKTGFVID